MKNRYTFEGYVKEMSKSESGGMSILTTENSGFMMPAHAKTDHVKIGSKVEICGGWGDEIRGVIIDGITCFTRTQEEIDADHQRWLAEYRAQKLKEFEDHKVAWAQAVDSLPRPLYNRMMRFINQAGGFEAYFKEDGSYELFICTEAVKFAEYFAKYKNEHNFSDEQMFAYANEFMQMGYVTQQSLVPFDDGHSGNTFGGAVNLGLRVALGMEV